MGLHPLRSLWLFRVKLLDSRKWSGEGFTMDFIVDSCVNDPTPHFFWNRILFPYQEGKILSVWKPWKVISVVDHDNFQKPMEVFLKSVRFSWKNRWLKRDNTIDTKKFFFILLAYYSSCSNIFDSSEKTINLLLQKYFVSSELFSARCVFCRKHRVPLNSIIIKNVIDHDFSFLMR